MLRNSSAGAMLALSFLIKKDTDGQKEFHSVFVSRETI